ncbi:hypothetical protein [Leptospira saintgironsiae]|uniref:Restriction endonuclease n=1 Tax=Leptospira saintgironsiae TaxID=2023183 RepID=A0A2M9Y7C8_9LEPT|nr:hypothetical protein [Leptospira saintgironsiae]PJZ47461.1 hypothetical protein CH362_19090 [Leptospira saintgironsiae]
MKFFQDGDVKDLIYSNCRDNGYLTETKVVIEELWSRICSLNLLGDNKIKFINDAKDNFTGAVWQLQLTDVLNKRHKLKEPKEFGPDIIIQTGSKDITIECVASNKSGKNKIEGISGQPIILDEEKLMLRILESISQKKVKYTAWLENGKIDQDSPFIIGIDTSAIPDGDVIGLPETNLIEKVLFSIGKHVFKVNLQSGEIAKEFEERREIIKNSGNSVETALFENDEYSFISGIIWNNTNIITDYSLTGSRFIFYRNPKARNPVQIKILDKEK